MLRVGEAGKVQERLPPWFEDAIRQLRKVRANEAVFLSEGDKTRARVRDKERNIVMEVVMPKILPDGGWVINMKKLSEAMKETKGKLMVEDDKVLYGDENVGYYYVVGERNDYAWSGSIVDKNTVTAEAVVDMEVLRAAANTGYDESRAIVGLAATPDGVKIGVFDRWGQRVVVDLPQKLASLRSFRGESYTYVDQKLLRQALSPEAKTVTVRWGNNTPLELEYNLGEILVKTWLSPVKDVESEYSVRWFNEDRGKLIGVINRDDYEIMRSLMGPTSAIWSNGVLAAEYNGRNGYEFCAHVGIMDPATGGYAQGTWEIYGAYSALPRADLYFVTKGHLPLYASIDGKLYAGGWLIGKKAPDKKLSCPNVVGPPLPPAAVNAMKTASAVFIRDDGIYVAPKIGLPEIQVARANLNLPSEISILTGLEKLPGNTWRLGIMPDGKTVIIDAGKVKMIVY